MRCSGDFFYGASGDPSKFPSLDFSCLAGRIFADERGTALHFVDFELRLDERFDELRPTAGQAAGEAKVFFFCDCRPDSGARALGIASAELEEGFSAFAWGEC